MDLNLIPTIHTGGMLLVVAPRAAKTLMTSVAAHLALRGPLRIMDGGNRFDAFAVARAIRRQTPALTEALERIHLARAFTCYQMLALLSQTPATPYPKVALGMLSTFYDGDVALTESRRLLRESVAHLRRLSRLAPVVVSVRPPPAEQPDRASLLDFLQEAAETTYILEPEPILQQARLL